MSLEDKGYSRQEYEALEGEKESLHDEARSEAEAEDIARTEMKTSQEAEAQIIAEKKEAGELLKKMHESAGIRPEPQAGKENRSGAEIVEAERKREESSKQFEMRAAERNENRPFFKRIFGLGKISSIDIAQEEAGRIDQAVDKATERLNMSKDAAAEKIARASSEFADKTPEEVHYEELVKNLSPEAFRVLGAGQLGAARESFNKTLSEVKDGNERRRLGEGMEQLISGKLDSLVAGGGLQAFRTLVEENGIRAVGLEQVGRMLGRMPQEAREEIAQSPKIKQEVIDDIRQVFSGNREYGVKKANEYVQMGLVTNEDAAAFFQSPEVQETLINDIRQVFNGNREYGVKKANEYVQMGLVTNEVAAAFFQSPEVQETLINDIKQVFSGNREYGVNKANEYVQMRLITNETAQKALGNLK